MTMTPEEAYRFIELLAQKFNFTIISTEEYNRLKALDLQIRREKFEEKRRKILNGEI